MAWKTVHRKSGATVIEHLRRGCKFTVVPKDWSKPKGPAIWAMTCGARHKRGEAKTVRGAKAAALRAGKKR
jgi:hypothetical protein